VIFEGVCEGEVGLLCIVHLCKNIFESPGQQTALPGLQCVTTSLPDSNLQLQLDSHTFSFLFFWAFGFSSPRTKFGRIYYQLLTCSCGVASCTIFPPGTLV
jgi:hypothetical protein